MRARGQHSSSVWRNSEHGQRRVGVFNKCIVNFSRTNAARPTATGENFMMRLAGKSRWQGLVESQIRYELRIETRSSSGRL